MNFSPDDEKSMMSEISLGQLSILKAPNQEPSPSNLKNAKSKEEQLKSVNFVNAESWIKPPPSVNTFAIRKISDSSSSDSEGFVPPQFSKDGDLKAMTESEFSASIAPARPALAKVQVSKNSN